LSPQLDLDLNFLNCALHLPSLGAPRDGIEEVADAVIEPGAAHVDDASCSAKPRPGSVTGLAPMTHLAPMPTLRRRPTLPTTVTPAVAALVIALL